MDFALPVLNGIGLSMGSFAVSLAIGTITRTRLLECCAYYRNSGLGTFQAGMTLLGRATVSSLTGIIDGFDHWLAFLLLHSSCQNDRRRTHKGGLRRSTSHSSVYSGNCCIHRNEYPRSGCRDLIRISSTGYPCCPIIIGIVAFILSFAGVTSGIRLKSVVGKKLRLRWDHSLRNRVKHSFQPSFCPLKIRET